MVDSITKIVPTLSESSLPREKDPASLKDSPGTKHPSDAFLELIVDNYRDSKRSQKLSPLQHQAARRQVFEKIVSSTLAQPQNPFAPLVSTPRGREMISAIIEELVQSHYRIS